MMWVGEMKNVRKFSICRDISGSAQEISGKMNDYAMGRSGIDIVHYLVCSATQRMRADSTLHKN
jgi:hypothetical protein